MTPWTGFDAALNRAKNQLNLYELIHDTRHREVRSDWSSEFLKIMHWPASEKIVRVDGHNRNSVLVFREACNISREYFSHEHVSELLRSAVVVSVSALDRMLHDYVVKHSWKLLTRREDDVPKKLQQLSISALEARKALEKLRRDGSSRPGSVIKKAIQERLHRDYTFQTPDGVMQAARMLGIDDFWGRVAQRMPDSTEKSDVISTLKKITARRNQIVHEADLIRTNRQEPSLRPILHDQVAEWVHWMGKFGAAIDEIVKEHI